MEFDVASLLLSTLPPPLGLALTKFDAVDAGGALATPVEPGERADVLKAAAWAARFPPVGCCVGGERIGGVGSDVDGGEGTGAGEGGGEFTGADGSEGGDGDVGGDGSDGGGPLLSGGGDIGDWGGDGDDGSPPPPVPCEMSNTTSVRLLEPRLANSVVWPGSVCPPLIVMV